MKKILLSFAHTYQTPLRWKKLLKKYKKYQGENNMKKFVDVSKSIK